MARRRKPIGIHRYWPSAFTLIPRACGTSREYTGEGTRAFAALVLVCWLSVTAHGQSRYFDLPLNADAAGVISVRGDGVQGVDWQAAGRSSVVVPLLVYDGAADDVSLTVDGKPSKMPLSSLVPRADDAVSTGPAFDNDAYQLTELWQPGRSDATRHWTLLATGIAVLVLGVAAHADPKRATLWIVGAGIGLSVGVVYCFPKDAPRRILPAERRGGWEWVWQAAATARTADEAWSPGLRFVPQSPAQLKQADPVLHCDAAGRPVSISVKLGQDRRAVFIRPLVGVNRSG